MVWQGWGWYSDPAAISLILLSTWCGLGFRGGQCCLSGFAREEITRMAALLVLEGHPPTRASLLASHETPSPSGAESLHCHT